MMTPPRDSRARFPPPPGKLIPDIETDRDGARNAKRIRWNNRVTAPRAVIPTQDRLIKRRCANPSRRSCHLLITRGFGQIGIGEGWEGGGCHHRRWCIAVGPADDQTAKLVDGRPARSAMLGSGWFKTALFSWNVFIFFYSLRCKSSN